MVNSLRVLTATPANGQTTSLSPGTITLTFNRPVNFSTLTASDLTFTGLPPGVTVTVGAPIAVDNPQFPTIVAFPISVTTSSGSGSPTGSTRTSCRARSSGRTVRR